MRFHITRRIVVVGLSAALALALSGIAGAAGISITMKLKTPYARAHRTACHRTKSFRLFHRGAVIEARGFVLPAPARHTAVRVELKRCVRGQYRYAGSRFATTKLLTGKFKAFFSAAPLAPRSRRRRAVTYYYARPIALGVRGPKVYFAVTN